MGNQEFARNVAAIGAGTWGKNLVRNLYQLGVLHTICDHSEDNLKRHSELYPEAKQSRDHNAVLADPEIAHVVIATPAFTHFDIAKQALNAGKDVYVEKPLCMNTEEAEVLVALAKDKGKQLMVGHQLHYHPSFCALEKMVVSGELGRIQYVSSHRMNLGRFRTEENAWWNFAPHDISLILSLCGNQLPDQVRSSGTTCVYPGVSDNSVTTMRFPNGIKAHIYVSWITPYKEQKLVVVGTKAMAVFDDTKPWDEKLTVYRDYVEWQDGNIPVHVAKEGEKIPVDEAEPLRAECLHFLSSCQSKEMPVTSGAKAVQTQRVLEAAQLSMDHDGKAFDPRKIHQQDSLDYFAHPTAVVDSAAVVGKDSKIWHFSHIMDGAELGSKCNIGQNVVVSPGVKLGKNVKVQNNVSLYSGLTCEDHVFIGPSAVFTNIKNPRSEVVRRHLYQETALRKGCTVGANATILCGVELGEYCFIGAGAVVTKDVKPYALVLGSPGKQVGWMSRHGEQLDLPLQSDEAVTALCPVTGELYRLEGDSLSFVGDLVQPRSSLSPELAGC